MTPVSPGVPVVDDEVVDVLRVLAHPVGLKLIFAIRDTELAVGQIESATGVGQPLLSQQLGVLRNARIVETRREAKQIFYRLKSDALAPLRALVDQFDPRTASPMGQQGGADSAAHFARIVR